MLKGLILALLLFPFLLALLAGLQLSDFLGNLLVLGPCVQVLNVGTEGFQFLTDAARLLLLCLAFTNLADSVLYALVALAQEFFSLLLGSLQNFLTALFNVGEVALVSLDGALHILLALMNGLALALPVALVANDVLQVFVALYVVASHDV